MLTYVLTFINLHSISLKVFYVFLNRSRIAACGSFVMKISNDVQLSLLSNQLFHPGNFFPEKPEALFVFTDLLSAYMG